MKIIRSVLVLSIIFLGGCGLLNKDVANIDPKKLPDVVAFQDEYTRGFMASTEEVDEGYYLFESKTGGYTMWYPEDAQMDNTYYQKSKEDFEAIKFGGENFYVYVTYNDLEDTKETDLYLHLLSSNLHYDGEFEKNTLDDKTLYLASMDNLSEDAKEKFIVIFGYIQSNSSDQAVRFEYHLICKNDNCDHEGNDTNSEFQKMINSIVFNP